MNNREKLNEIPDPDSAEWTQYFGASVGLTVVASGRLFALLPLLSPRPPPVPPSSPSQSYMTSIYNVLISFLSF